MTFKCLLQIVISTYYLPSKFITLGTKLHKCFFSSKSVTFKLWVGLNIGIYSNITWSTFFKFLPHFFNRRSQGWGSKHEDFLWLSSDFNTAFPVYLMAESNSPSESGFQFLLCIISA